MIISKIQLLQDILSQPLANFSDHTEKWELFLQYSPKLNTEPLKKIFFYWVENKKPVSELESYFVFCSDSLTPLEICNLFTKLKRDHPSWEQVNFNQTIEYCLQKNEIPTVFFDNLTKDTYILLFILAYLANENEQSFIPQREKLFTFYANNFKSINISIPAVWMVVTDTNLTFQWNCWLAQIHTNKIAAVAIQIAFRSKPKSLQQMLHFVEITYEKLNDILNHIPEEFYVKRHH
jgi:hypothetical protein